MKNLVLGGLWFGEHKPVMGTFLKPFQEALSRLKIQGMLSFAIYSINCSKRLLL